MLGNIELDAKEMHAQNEIETNPVIGLRAKNMEKHSFFSASNFSHFCCHNSKWTYRIGLKNMNLEQNGKHLMGIAGMAGSNR